MSEQPGHGSAGTPGTPGHGFSAISAGPAQARGDGELTGQFGDASPAPADGNGERSAEFGGAIPAQAGRDGQRTSEFGRFDWFAELDDFGHAAGTTDNRAPTARPPWDGERIASSQQAGNGDQAGNCDQAGDGGQAGNGQRDISQANGGPRQGWRGRFLRGWRLALAAFVLAVACTLLGGVMGGFVALHSQSGLSDSSYSLGSVPPALTNRPASSVAGIAARDTPGVVMIKVNDGEGTGSGFLIQGGYIVTDNHVVTLDGLLTSASLRVYFSNGRSAKGVVVGRDPYSDIAVIKAQGVTNLPALTLGNSNSVAVGDPVIAIGSPLGLADTVTSGIVSAVERPVQPTAAGANVPQVFFDAIQTDAPINPGNSGGPLVNARGQVIGVDAAIDTLGNDPITGTQGGSIGLGFAIPIDQARRVVTELIRTGHATHSVVGAALNENYTGNGAQIMTGRHGTVTPGGPAARAGLEPGDVITEVGGREVTSGYALLDAIRSLVPGSRVAVTFLRQGQTHQTELTLGSASS
jgi:S1-C subfamily serine protease